MSGRGAQGWVDPRDVAEALTTVEHEGRVLTLTGPELLSVPDVVAVLAEEPGRPLRTDEIAPHAVRERWRSTGRRSSGRAATPW